MKTTAGARRPDLLDATSRGAIDDIVPFFVGGEWRHSADGSSMETINPATGASLARVAVAGPDDLQLAVDRGRAAADQWAAAPVRHRAEAIVELGRRVKEDASRFGTLDALDTGSPLRAMTADAVKGGDTLAYLGGLASEVYGRTIPVSRDSLHYTMLQPWGVVARIIAFNHPTLFACARLAPALAAGNSVIIKPSELAPLGALAVAEAAADLLPQGVLSVLTGGPELGRAIVAHPDIRRLSFTGSIATGLLVQREASESGVIKALTLELGGKNPIIVFPDADLDAAARAAVRGMNFARVQGQSCGSTSRLFVHSDVHDSVVARVAELAAGIKIGSPIDPSTEMGSMINSAAQTRCFDYATSAVADGASLVLGGKRPDDPALQSGAFVLPTILDGVPRAAAVAREEVFGPVLSVFEWTDEHEMLQHANALRYGLTASVWTPDISKALRTVEALECGYVWVNDVETRFLNVPFGGWKDSGYGLEQGLEEILSFTRTKSVNIAFVDN